MIKIIVGVFLTVYLVISAIVVLYWRDINFDPSGSDLLIFFALLPVAITAFLVMPYMIYHWIKEQKNKQNDPQLSDEIAIEELQPEPVDRINLNVYRAYALNALGENHLIIDAIREFKSPELDDKLLNGYGLPILSYRISDLDVEQDEEDEYSFKRQYRIHQLILTQLEQQTEILWEISEHLKKSALFYDTQISQSYRMHPAWIDPQAEYHDGEEDTPSVQQVYRLNKLKIHLVLAEELLHVWDEQDSEQLISDYLSQLNYIPEVFHVEHHYWGVETSYSEWIHLLQSIEKDESSISLVFIVDSEIDQDTLDEKIWISEQYIPAEYISSCCLASPKIQIENVLPTKTLDIAINEKQLKQSLDRYNIDHQFKVENEQPFTVLLDDITQLKTLKKIEQNFANMNIEQHHYLMLYPTLGNTQSLAKIFGFTLAFQFDDALMTMVYTTQNPDVQTFIQTYQSESDINPEQQNV